MLSFSRWRLGAGALCAASGVTIYLAVPDGGASAFCDASQQRPQSAVAAAASRVTELAALADWLRQQGADIDAIQFKQSDKVCACGIMHTCVGFN